MQSSQAEVWYLKPITFKGTQLTIVTQNFNGPCSFIAICNILILRGDIQILPRTRQTVSYEFLSQLVAEYLLVHSANIDISPALSIMPYTQTGMNLNPLFTSSTSFRPSSGGELALFLLSGIPLVHGWLVDPDSPAARAMMEERTEDYDSAVALIAEADHLAGGMLVQVEEVIKEGEPGPSTGGHRKNGKAKKRRSLTPEDRRKVRNALAIRAFIDSTSSQLTYHGLFHLASTLPSGELVALFRSSHLSVLYKNGEDVYIDGDIVQHRHGEEKELDYIDARDPPNTDPNLFHQEKQQLDAQPTSIPAHPDHSDTDSNLSVPNQSAPPSEVQPSSSRGSRYSTDSSPPAVSAPAHSHELEPEPEPEPVAGPEYSHSHPQPDHEPEHEHEDHPRPPSPPSQLQRLSRISPTPISTHTPSSSNPPSASASASEHPSTSGQIQQTITPTSRAPTPPPPPPQQQHERSGSALYTLVTDQVFLHEPSVVWERIADVDGANGLFVDGEFVRSSPAGGDFAGRTAEETAWDIQEAERAVAVDSVSDEELARQFQAEEDERYRYHLQVEMEREERERRWKREEEEVRRQRGAVILSRVEREADMVQQRGVGVGVGKKRKEKDGKGCIVM